MSGSVKAIDRRTVHQICSGQVVLSLAVAVKELVENSLDAGATNIEVRLREHGLDLVEVSDNGSGVSEDNFEALTLKHHTSKIKDFSDLEVGVATFGFRGEALSSLCALCDLCVTTCHSSASVGTRLEYDNDGRIKNKTSCARETGTTVSLQNLFHTLPVRHKEFTRNVKKEFHRMVQLLQGYCLISTGVRIACFNQLTKGGRQLVLSTTGNSTISENIVNCFGPKQFRQLVEIAQYPVDQLPEDELTATSIKPEALSLFKVSGYISHCHHGYGRSAADRQFYFFNNRPCDHSKLSKTVNEVYHMYNRQQYPFVVLNITTAREHVDVNVTPDKRQVMLHQEKAMITLVKVSLTRLFEPLQEQFDTSQLDQSTASGSLLSTPSPLHTLTPPPSTPSLGALARLKRSHPGSCGSKDALCDRKPKQAKLWDYGSTISKASPGIDGSKVEEGGGVGVASTDETESESPLARRRRDDQSEHTTGQDDSPMAAHDSPQIGSPLPQYQSDSSAVLSEGSTTSQGSLQCGSLQTEEITSANVLEPVAVQIVEETHKIDRTCSEDEGRLSSSSSKKHGVIIDRKEVAGTQQRNVATMSMAFSLGATTERLSWLQGHHGGALVEEKEGESDGRRFRAKINPANNSQAEEELRKHISKSDFLKMKILGQFNLGFIITRLGHDLFIVDQHASDEKYNFECLQRDTVIQHQRLIQPKLLELTAVGENVVMDNLEIFKLNGFQFEIDPEAMPTKRVKLIGQPVSKNWSLGPKDIDELIFMLSDGNCGSSEVVRPSAVRAMFASRACRSSIMIGTALSRSNMRKVVDHMATLEQPWCCPHGRPTMRHIIDLQKLQY